MVIVKFEVDDEKFGEVLLLLTNKVHNVNYNHVVQLPWNSNRPKEFKQRRAKVGEGMRIVKGILNAGPMKLDQLREAYKKEGLNSGAIPGILKRLIEEGHIKKLGKPRERNTEYILT